MQRRNHLISTVPTAVLAASLTVTLVVSATGCTGGSGADGGGSGTFGGTADSAAQARPGKHETLPEPCGAVGTGALRELLPLAASHGPVDAGGRPKAYQGEATVTYDTDRRVGCRWKSTSSLGTRHLFVDFQRVVSYDGTVSDEAKAVELYQRKAEEADVPQEQDSLPAASAPPSSGPDSPKSSEGGDKDAGNTEDAVAAESPEDAASPEGTEEGQAGGPGTAGPEETGGPGTGSGTPDPSRDGADAMARTLEDLGSAAFLNDELDTGDSGVHRDITLVFRTSNVIVTVEYAQWMTDKYRIPDSTELQEKAQALAEQLFSEFED